MIQHICGGQNDIEISLRTLYLFLFSYMDPRIWESYEQPQGKHSYSHNRFLVGKRKRKIEEIGAPWQMNIKMLNSLLTWNTKVLSYFMT